MKLLVLGNGFDLDHDLPTSYFDFLNFCNNLLSANGKDPLGSPAALKDSQKKYIQNISENESLKDRFISLIDDNIFLKYFNLRIKLRQEKWIDLEQEIKSVINTFNIIAAELRKSGLYSYTPHDNHIVYQLVHELHLSRFISASGFTEKNLKDIHTILCEDFEKFSTALETYIYHFVNTTEVRGISPDIINFNADKILTFNYSDTYERIYGGISWKEEIDYIHGKAVECADEQSDIILGITSDQNNFSFKNDYVEFEKYFQRITKKTGNKYKNWLQSRLGKNEHIEISFFGHSLYASDSDIIKDLVYHDKSKITIFYHSQNSYKEIVANLIEVIGKDTLIKYVSGDNPKISFIQQRKHQSDNSAGIEIKRDKLLIYRLHTLKQIEIDILLKKITDKIEKQDLFYFHSQEATIDLFEALKYKKIHQFSKSSFFEICSLLDFKKSKNGSLVNLSDKDYYGFDFQGDEIPCDPETSKLIDEVNQLNKRKFTDLESRKKHAQFLQIKTSEEFKEALLKLFNEDNPTKEYWGNLQEIIHIVANNKNFEIALSDLVNSDGYSIAVSCKILNFNELYENYCYNLGLMQELNNV